MSLGCIAFRASRSNCYRRLTARLGYRAQRVTSTKTAPPLVSETHDVIAGLCVVGDVDDVVFDSRFVECAVSGIALHTCGFGIYGDRHSPLSVILY